MLSRIFEQNPWMTRNQRLQMTLDAISHGSGYTKLGDAEAIRQIAQTHVATNSEVAALDKQLADKALPKEKRDELELRRKNAIALARATDARLSPATTAKESPFEYTPGM
jgi:hypothetical protein